jgi:hypothetical protein
MQCRMSHVAVAVPVTFVQKKCELLICTQSPLPLIIKYGTSPSNNVVNPAQLYLGLFDQIVARSAQKKSVSDRTRTF